MTAADEAKQLDSVTDYQLEAELDESKAKQAMSALSSSAKGEDEKSAALAAIAVSKEDVELIVSEMEVSDEVAERVLREVAAEAGEGKMLEAALRKLVTS